MHTRREEIRGGHSESVKETVKGVNTCEWILLGIAIAALDKRCEKDLRWHVLGRAAKEQWSQMCKGRKSNIHYSSCIPRVTHVDVSGHEQVWVSGNHLATAPEGIAETTDLTSDDITGRPSSAQPAARKQAAPRPGSFRFRYTLQNCLIFMQWNLWKDMWYGWYGCNHAEWSWVTFKKPYSNNLTPWHTIFLNLVWMCWFWSDGCIELRRGTECPCISGKPASLSGLPSQEHNCQSQQRGSHVANMANCWLCKSGIIGQHGIDYSMNVARCESNQTIQALKADFLHFLRQGDQPLVVPVVDELGTEWYMKSP